MCTSGVTMCSSGVIITTLEHTCIMCTNGVMLSFYCNLITATIILLESNAIQLWLHQYNVEK